MPFLFVRDYGGARFDQALDRSQLDLEVTGGSSPSLPRSRSTDDASLVLLRSYAMPLCMTYWAYCAA